MDKPRWSEQSRCPLHIRAEDLSDRIAMSDGGVVKCKDPLLSVMVPAHAAANPPKGKQPVGHCARAQASLKTHLEKSAQWKIMNQPQCGGESRSGRSSHHSPSQASAARRANVRRQPIAFHPRIAHVSASRRLHRRISSG